MAPPKAGSWPFGELLVVCFLQLGCDDLNFLCLDRSMLIPHRQPCSQIVLARSSIKHQRSVAGALAGDANVCPVLLPSF